MNFKTMKAELRGEKGGDGKGRGGETTMTLKFTKLGKQSHVSTGFSSFVQVQQSCPGVQDSHWNSLNSPLRKWQGAKKEGAESVDGEPHAHRGPHAPSRGVPTVVCKWPVVFLARVGPRTIWIPLLLPVSGRVCRIYCDYYGYGEYQAAFNLISFYFHSFQK